MKVVIVLLVAALLAVGGVFVLYARLNAPYRGFAGQEQYVEIPPGSGTSAIGRRLVGAGVVRDTVTYRLALWLSGRARHLQAGDYRFEGAMTARDVIEKIARGDVDRISITFPEGLSIVEMSWIFEAH